jgi:hypothetical protein
MKSKLAYTALSLLWLIFFFLYHFSTKPIVGRLAIFVFIKVTHFPPPLQTIYLVW